MAGKDPSFGSVRCTQYRGHDVEIRVERQTTPYGWVAIIRIWRRRTSGPRQLGPWRTDAYPTATVAESVGLEYAHQLVDGWLDE